MKNKYLSTSFLAASTFVIAASLPAYANSPAALLGGHPRSLEAFPSESQTANAATAQSTQTAQSPSTQPVRSAPTQPAKSPGNLIDRTMSSPEGKPGECYARVLVAPTMKTVTERVLARDESVEMTEVPAVIETVEERTIVSPASERQEIIPATTKEVQERVLKTPAYTRQIPVPAEFETRTEQVLVKPARSFWKKGAGPMQKFNGETGEIMCYVTEEAVYETVSRKVVTKPASYREETVPAVYETVTRTVVDQPAKIRNIAVPAEYAMVPVQKVKSPARVEKRVIPAEYKTFTREEASGEGSLEWRRVLCETNVTPDVVADIQTALNARGHQVGAVDGIYGKSTSKAVDDFQGANRLPQGGLTYETLAALNVSL